jgi:hypothetical protein
MGERVGPKPIDHARRLIAAIDAIYRVPSSSVPARNRYGVISRIETMARSLAIDIFRTPGDQQAAENLITSTAQRYIDHGAAVGDDRQVEQGERLLEHFIAAEKFATVVFQKAS